ncbi:2465_t:CDS:2 [Racocetra fulgida]|uniref:2465_t:CDS:1 n=1 Tax=Racocetra fulgida TaxID=60492 RepID=A0A9N9FMB9_9GLOM|nr:2465_t:CDS:2 [Racocetra fulgida]
MSLSRESHNLQVGNEKTLQLQENLTIEWNRLRVTDLRVMCSKCNIPTDSTKAELISCLEDLWSVPEKDFNIQKLDKGRAGEWNSSEDFDDERPLPSDEVMEQNYAFLSYMENRLEQKLEKKLENSLSKYDAVCEVGTMLQKAIQEDSKKKVMKV